MDFRVIVAETIPTNCLFVRTYRSRSSLVPFCKLGGLVYLAREHLVALLEILGISSKPIPVDVDGCLRTHVLTWLRTVHGVLYVGVLDLLGF